MSKAKSNSKKSSTHISRATLLLALTGLLTVAPALAAFAAPTYQPDKTDATVYFDPLLKADTAAPINLDSLAPALAKEAKRHGLKFYVVIAKQGDESPASCKKGFAVCRLEDLMLKWSSKLEQDNYVLLLVVRSNTDPKKFSYAINLGNRARILGLGANNVNLDSAARGGKGRVAYLPRDVAGFASAVAGDINALFDQALSAKEAAQAKKEFEAALPGRIALGGGLLSLLLTAVFLFFRYHNARKEAKEAIDAFRASLDRANGNYMALETEYHEFLSQQGSDWSSRFSGITLVAYAAAVKDYADLSARIEAASLRLSEADAAVRNNGFLSVSGLQQAVSLVQDVPVTVTGDILVLEKRTLFGSAVQQFDYLPGQLLQNMGQLFDRTNQALSQMMPAFRDASENEGKVAELLASVNTLVRQLTALEVSATPYDVRRAAILTATQQFSDKMLSDPLSAYNESSEVVNSAQLLIDDLKKAIALVDTLAKTEERLASSVSFVQEKRQEVASSSFPDAETPADAPRTFLLAEPGHNPDAIAAQVRECLCSASHALQQGNIAECNSQNDCANTLIDDLNSSVTAILAARSFVGREVVTVNKALEQLRLEVPLAEQALTSLSDEFLPDSFRSVVRNVTAAVSVAEQAGGRLDEVKSAYFEQHFIAAEEQLIAVRAAIQSSREGLSAIHIALDTLLRLKASAQEANRNLQIAFSALEVKISEKDFSTSAKTIQEVGLQRKQVALVSNLASSVKPDWEKIKQDAEQLTRAIHSIAQTIDSQVLAHSEASRGIELSQSRFDNASLLVAQDQVRDAASNKLQLVCELLSAAQLNMQTAHYDWEAVSQSLDQVDIEIAAAEELAKADIKLADTSKRAVYLAKCRIEEVPSSYATEQEIGGETITFGADVVADTSAANAALRRAEAALLLKQYEIASQLADSATSAAQTAQENAENAVEALVAAAVLAWQLVEKQRLETLAEEERQAKLVKEAADQLLREQQAAELIVSSTVIVDSSSDSSASLFSSDNADTGSGSFGGGDIAESDSFTTDAEPEESEPDSFGGGDF